MKIKTVAYKGSKRKLLENIEHYAREIGAQSFFDGFSGTGIVGAYMRSKGYVVQANDMNHSSYIYGKVFLRGFDVEVVAHHLEVMNNIEPVAGWLTENYSGSIWRKVKPNALTETQEMMSMSWGHPWTQFKATLVGGMAWRPLGYTKQNAMKLDAARDYVANLSGVCEDNRNALIFSIVLAADKVFNNSNDQKSALKDWTTAAKRGVKFISPTLIEGPLGEQHSGNIIGMKLKSDLVYLDPPYTHGVLYASCYHLSDSIAKWGKPELDHSYALPRPLEVCYRKNGETAGGFYNKETATAAFHKIIGDADCKRVLLSYSDAPRNTLTIEELVDICSNYGTVRIESKDHRLCMQPKNMRKISTNLKEFFIVIDKKGR